MRRAAWARGSRPKDRWPLRRPCVTKLRTQRIWATDDDGQHEVARRDGAVRAAVRPYVLRRLGSPHRRLRARRRRVRAHPARLGAIARQSMMMSPRGGGDGNGIHARARVAVDHREIDVALRSSVSTGRGRWSTPAPRQRARSDRVVDGDRTGELARVVPLHEEREPGMTQRQLEPRRSPGEQRAVGPESLPTLGRQTEGRDATLLDRRGANGPTHQAVAVGGRSSSERPNAPVALLLTIDRHPGARTELAPSGTTRFAVPNPGWIPPSTTEKPNSSNRCVATSRSCTPRYHLADRHADDAPRGGSTAADAMSPVSSA